MRPIPKQAGVSCTKQNRIGRCKHTYLITLIPFETFHSFRHIYKISSKVFHTFKHYPSSIFLTIFWLIIQSLVPELPMAVHSYRSLLNTYPSKTTLFHHLVPGRGFHHTSFHCFTRLCKHHKHHIVFHVQHFSFQRFRQRHVWHGVRQNILSSIVRSAKTRADRRLERLDRCNSSCRFTATRTCLFAVPLLLVLTLWFNTLFKTSELQHLISYQWDIPFREPWHWCFQNSTTMLDPIIPQWFAKWRYTLAVYRGAKILNQPFRLHKLRNKSFIRIWSSAPALPWASQKALRAQSSNIFIECEMWDISNEIDKVFISTCLAVHSTWDFSAYHGLEASYAEGDCTFWNNQML